MEKNVIVIGGSYLGLGIIRSLAMKKIRPMLLNDSAEDFANKSRFVKRLLLCPSFAEYGKIRDYLMQNRKELGGSLIIPAGDPQLECLAAHKKELSKHYIIPVPDFVVCQEFLDKKKTYAIAKKAGVLTPYTAYPESIKDLELGSIRYPLLMKPRVRHLFYDVFKTKLFVIQGEKDLLEKMRQCDSHGVKVMITEIIPGPDTNLYSYNFYISKSGKELAGICQQKLRQDPPNFGLGRVTRTVDNEKIIELTRKFIKRFPGFYGAGHLEYKLDPRDSQYKLMEMNGRIILQNHMFAKAGINFANTYYDEWVNGKEEYKSDFVHGFHMINLLSDIFNTFKRHREEKYSLAEYIRPYLSRHVFLVESIHDAGPMFHMWGQKAAKYRRKVIPD